MLYNMQREIYWRYYLSTVVTYFLAVSGAGGALGAAFII